MFRKIKSMDVNNAARMYPSFSELAAIYPIHPTPSSAHGRTWWTSGPPCTPERTSSATEVKVGWRCSPRRGAVAAGTVHGSLAAGALTTRSPRPRACC